MVDDLARIESIYGCIAEYNRCMAETEEYEPTEEEIAENERLMTEYHAEIKRLNGTESGFIRRLVTEWEKSKPEYNGTNASIYAGYDWSRERTLDIVAKVAEHYGVEVDEEWATFYRVPKGKFAISVEYHDHGRILCKHIGNLDFEVFKDIFRDLHYAGERPTMKFGNMILSNCSLGELLRNELREVI